MEVIAVNEKPMFVPWDKYIFNRDASLNLIIFERRRGKTFGLREQMLRDYLANGERHVAIVRHKDDIQVVANGYFDDVAEKTGDEKLKRKLADYEFLTQGSTVKIRRKSDDAKKRNKWDTILTVIPLSKADRYKQITLHKLRRVAFDEALIDKKLNPYSRYLPNEFAILQNVIGTLERYADPDSSGRCRLRVYLMGNAVDLTNAYFAALGINEPPAFGSRWLANKTWFFCYPDPADFAPLPPEKSIAAGMGERTSDYGNVFDASTTDFIEKKTRTAKFAFGVVYRGESFGVWADYNRGLYFINTKIPKDTPLPVYALSTDDNKPNYIVAKRANKTLQGLADLYCYGILRYDTPATREHFDSVLSLFGVR